MTTVTDEADQLGRRRARTSSALAIIFLATQGGSIATKGGSHIDLPFLLWVAVLLVILMFGGGWFSTAGVRQALNDETTKAHRRSALACGFVIALIAAVMLYVLTFFEEVTSREALRLLITMAVAGALLRFGTLEKRALADA